MRKYGSAIAVTLACTIAAGGAALAQKSSTDCELKLRNGSVIKGKLNGFTAVTLKTKYGELRVPQESVRSATWGDSKKEEPDSVSTREGTYKGTIQHSEPLEVDTGFGILRIPTNVVKRLRVVGDRNVIREEFDDDNLDDWTKFGGAQWSVNGGQLQVQPQGGYDSIQLNEEMEGLFTLEVDINSPNGAGILWHAKSATEACGLWLGPGYARVMSGGTWFNQHTANWNPNIQWNATMRVKLEVDGENVVVYLNDARIGETRTSGNSGRIGLFATQPASFDNLEILRP
ncbi:MAG: DUF1080 domain-containing protein [Planctomycetes bacterium]|nr:DUF1080 domain-containing protein [Planctomycetota bacterium]